MITLPGSKEAFSTGPANFAQYLQYTYDTYCIQMIAFDIPGTSAYNVALFFIILN